MHNVLNKIFVNIYFGIIQISFCFVGLVVLHRKHVAVCFDAEVYWKILFSTY